MERCDGRETKDGNSCGCSTWEPPRWKSILVVESSQKMAMVMYLGIEVLQLGALRKSACVVAGGVGPMQEELLFGLQA